MSWDWQTKAFCHGSLSDLSSRLKSPCGLSQGLCPLPFPGEPGQTQVRRSPPQAEGQSLPGLTSSRSGKALEQAALHWSVASLCPLAHGPVIRVGPDPGPLGGSHARQ